jgi:hypothetical protein
MPHEIEKVRNGATLRDLRRLVQTHRRENLSDFLKHRGDYLIAAASHCPESVELEDWLRRWAMEYLHVPGLTTLDAKTAIAIACKPGRLSVEEIAKLLRVTFAKRRKLKLWTFGACDLSREERKARAKARKKRKDRKRAAGRRRQDGAKPHAESLSQTQPWKVEGISRRTYERRRAKAEADKGGV